MLEDVSQKGLSSAFLPSSQDYLCSDFVCQQDHGDAYASLASLSHLNPVSLKDAPRQKEGSKRVWRKDIRQRRFSYLRTPSRGTKHHQMHARPDGFFKYKWDDNFTSSPTRRKPEALSFLTLVQRL
ncbi:hypothetical protein EDD85DRAFT_959855 [Armillaria nabsnona]|nr:hypothetical protein EDD85DRAFT_959855 [Armillaria nabsnona]